MSFCKAKLSLGVCASRAGIFKAFVSTKPTFFAFEFYLCGPLVSLSPYARSTASVVCALRQIAHILGLRHVAQIRDAIIAWVTVDVVNNIWPFAVVYSPCNTMGLHHHIMDGSNMVAPAYRRESFLIRETCIPCAPSSLVCE